MAEQQTPQDSSPTIRLKIMPTPSGRLHVGHAWLLMVMQALAQKATENGAAAELLVVLDGIQMADKANANANEALIREDLKLLGLETARVLRNDQPPYGIANSVASQLPYNTQAMSHAAIRPPYFFLFHNARYILQNAMIDAALGVTHVVRGGDQIYLANTYLTAYNALGVTVPALMYFPLLCNHDGGKISASQIYTVVEVLKYLSPDELFCLLASHSVQRPEGTPPAGDRAGAQQLLLGDDWQFILGGEEAEAKRASFLNRMVAQPKLPSRVQLFPAA